MNYQKLKEKPIFCFQELIQCSLMLKFTRLCSLFKPCFLRLKPLRYTSKYPSDTQSKTKPYETIYTLLQYLVNESFPPKKSDKIQP